MSPGTLGPVEETVDAIGELLVDLLHSFGPISTFSPIDGYSEIIDNTTFMEDDLEGRGWHRDRASDRNAWSTRTTLVVCGTNASSSSGSSGCFLAIPRFGRSRLLMNMKSRI